MTREAELTGIVRPEVDQRQLNREAGRVGDAMTEASQLTPDVNARSLKRKLKRALPGGGLLGGLMDRARGRGGGGDDGSGGGGLRGTAMLEVQRQTLKHQKASADHDEERNEILEDILDELDGTASGRSGAGGGGAGGGGLGLAGRGGTAGLAGLAGVLGAGVVGATRVLDRDAGERQEDRMGDLLFGDLGDRLQAAFATVQDPLGLGEGFAPAIDAIDWAKYGTLIGGAMLDKADRFAKITGAGLMHEVDQGVSNLEWPEPPDLTGLQWPEAPGWVQRLFDLEEGQSESDGGGDGGDGGGGGGRRPTNPDAVEQLTRSDPGSDARVKNRPNGQNIIVEDNSTVRVDSVRELERRLDERNRKLKQEIKRELGGGQGFTR